MGTYSDVIAKIDGKTFSSNYFYNTVLTNNGEVAQDFTPTAFNGTIVAIEGNSSGFHVGDFYYEIQGVGADSQSFVFRLITTSIHSSNVTYILSNTGSPPAGPVTINPSNPYNAPNPTCFAEGTHIATLTGNVAVENLAVGDVIRLANGHLAPVKWMGKRHVRCAASPWKDDVLPILIERHALGLFVPFRDLMVSPGHSIQVDDDLLVQAGYLVNGKTIRQVDVEAITYWHIELKDHSIVIANGVPAESYIDVGNRADFDCGGAVEALHPRFKTMQLESYCMPVAQDDEVRAPYQRKFAERAVALEAAFIEAA